MPHTHETTTKHLPSHALRQSSRLASPRLVPRTCGPPPCQNRTSVFVCVPQSHKFPRTPQALSTSIANSTRGHKFPNPTSTSTASSNLPKEHFRLPRVLALGFALAPMHRPWLLLLACACALLLHACPAGRLDHATPPLAPHDSACLCQIRRRTDLNLCLDWFVDP
jgi:hypothetical protein